jgi:hypothetical protein
MKAKYWNSLVIGSSLAILSCIALFTAVIDPFLHYHKPLDNLEYPLLDERYINDGITRNYTYNALITGTSMTQNFKASLFEDLWQVDTVKTSYSGASYHELNANIKRAIDYNPDLMYVLCSLDSSLLIYPADSDEYDDYPYYLYDNNIFNDVYYLLNKEVITKTLAVINYTRAGNKTPDMDEYGNWEKYKSFGKEAVMSSFSLIDIADEEHLLSQEDIELVRDNITENYLATALDNPDVTFYFFFPPYSICYWEALVRSRQLNAQLNAEEYAVSLLLQAENVHIYSFGTRTDIIGNLDNYTDTLHYNGAVNDEIMRCIYLGEYELTTDNYQEYYNNVREIYEQYDYSYLHYED